MEIRIKTGLLVSAALATCLAAMPAAAQSNPCSGFALGSSYRPTLPVRFQASGAIDSQITANCQAWQMFVYLNWQAQTGRQQPDTTVSFSQFGVLSGTAATVWQSYAIDLNVFNPSAGPQATPPPLVLKATSKFGLATVSGIDQASGPVWLTNQRGQLTYYDVRINQAEVDFIQQAMYLQVSQTVRVPMPLTASFNQYLCATARPAGSNAGFRLPMGYGNDTDCLGNAAKFGDDTGAIELKAAWTELPADGSLNYRYLTSQATITDPFGVTRTNVTVGLVGLHIIRRLPGASQMLWSTFEQVDNSPDQSVSSGAGVTPPNLPANTNRRPSPGYTYYNPQCNPQTDIYQCQANKAPGTPCAQGQLPTPSSPCYPYSAPQQVVRTTPVNADANRVNAYVWGALAPASVFNYYRLIDVQWPSNPAPQLTAGATVAGTGQGQSAYPTNMVPTLAVLNSNTRIIANTTMETYVQAGSGANVQGTCMDCHASAGISTLFNSGLAAGQTIANGRLRVLTSAPRSSSDAAATPVNPANLASSFSFIFSTDAPR